MIRWKQTERGVHAVDCQAQPAHGERFRALCGEYRTGRPLDGPPEPTCAECTAIACDMLGITDVVTT